jgi:hypothetical protein
VKEVERGVQEQLSTILTSRRPEIRNVDFDDIPFREDFIEEVVEELLEEFHYLRRRSSISWDIDERTGTARANTRTAGRSRCCNWREMYQHDWNTLAGARRMMDALAGTALIPARIAPAGAASRLPTRGAHTAWFEAHASSRWRRAQLAGIDSPARRHVWWPALRIADAAWGAGAAGCRTRRAAPVSSLWPAGLRTRTLLDSRW